MTMAIFRDDDSENYEFMTSVITSESYETTRTADIPLIRTKLRTPQLPEVVERKWLHELLDRSLVNSAATLLVGRAGSGKTALATHFAQRRPDHTWYSIDASDADWSAFQRYFRAAIIREGKDYRKGRIMNEAVAGSEPVELFADITAALELDDLEWPSLIVLDNVHHLYDCSWFGDFFAYLIASLPHSSHVILTSRSKPPTPVWRLRSKQVLNVIEERSLAFSPTEAVELFIKNGLNRDVALEAQAQTFGRPADMVAFILSADDSNGRAAQNS